MKTRYLVVLSALSLLFANFFIGTLKADLIRAQPSEAPLQSADLSPVGQVGGQAYDISVTGQYAYVGSGPSFSIYDISDPTQPERVGYAMLPDKVLGVHVVGDYAYLVTEGYFYVLSIADKNHPSVVGECVITGTGQGLDVVGNYAYVVTWSVGLQTISLADPANPAVVDMDSFYYGRKVRVSDGHVYVASNGGLYIFSLADPANPSQVGTYTPTDGSAVWDVRIVGQYAYAVGDDWLWVLDVSNPATPTLDGSTDELDFASGLTLDGSYAYVVGYLGDFFVVSIATPSTPTVLHSSEQPGNLGTSCAVSGDILYLANNAGLVVLSLTNPTAPILVRVAGRPGEAQEVVVRSGYAYVLTETDETHDYVDIFSLADPANPTWQGEWHRDMWALTAIHLNGDYLYVAYAHRQDGTSFFDEVGVQILSLTDPLHPGEVGRIALEIGSGSPIITALFVSGDYLYVANGHDIKIVSVANQSSPTLSATYTAGVDEPMDIHIAGQYAYVIDDWDTSTGRPARLKVLSLANPTAPVAVGSYDAPGHAYSVFAVGGYAYVTDRTNGLLVIDISDPTSPTQVGSYNTSGQAENLYVLGDYAFVADGTAGLRLISVADPANPTELDYYDTGVSGDVFVDDQYAYLADRTSGLVVLSYETPVISGRVTDADSNPLAGVVIDAGGTYSATTDGTGAYTLTVPSGQYTLSPATLGYFWEPPSRAVFVAGNMTGQDFVGRNIIKSGERGGNALAAAYGELITYTIHVVYPQDGDYFLYDLIPTTTTYISGSLSAPTGVIYDAAAEVITGPLTLTASISQTIIFRVQVAITGTAQVAPPVVNRACIYPASRTMTECQWSNEVAYPTYQATVYLPLVMSDAESVIRRLLSK